MSTYFKNLSIALVCLTAATACIAQNAQAALRARQSGDGISMQQQKPAHPKKRQERALAIAIPAAAAVLSLAIGSWCTQHTTQKRRENARKSDSALVPATAQKQCVRTPSRRQSDSDLSFSSMTVSHETPAPALSQYSSVVREIQFNKESRAEDQGKALENPSAASTPLLPPLSEESGDARSVGTRAAPLIDDSSFDLEQKLYEEARKTLNLWLENKHNPAERKRLGEELKNIQAAIAALKAQRNPGAP